MYVHSCDAYMQWKCLLHYLTMCYGHYVNVVATFEVQHLTK